jgi:hypothetical protein
MDDLFDNYLIAGTYSKIKKFDFILTGTFD